MTVEALFHGRPTPLSALAAWLASYEMWMDRRKEHHPDPDDPQGRQYGITLYLDADELRELLAEVDAWGELSDVPYFKRLVVDLRHAHEAVQKAPSR